MIVVTKKNPNKFTIGFKKNNVSHQKVVEILNNTEDKADFIASAVLHYLGEGKETDPLNGRNCDRSCFEYCAGSDSDLWMPYGSGRSGFGHGDQPDRQLPGIT